MTNTSAAEIIQQTRTRHRLLLTEVEAKALLRTAGVAVAQAQLARTKKSYFAAQYHRLAGRRGKKRAVLAVGHSLLVTGYHVITRQQDYADLGVQYFDDRDREAVTRRAVRWLAHLGFHVTLTPVAASAA